MSERSIVETAVEATAKRCPATHCVVCDKEQAIARASALAALRELRSRLPANATSTETWSAAYSGALDAVRRLIDAELEVTP